MGFTNHFQCFCLALLFVLGAWAPQAMSRTLQDESMYEEHEQWMSRYRRVYSDIYEKGKRAQIYKENVAFIDSFNKASNKSFKLAINEFADLTNEEFKALHNRMKGHMYSQDKLISKRYENFTAAPAFMDWRQRGAVTPIKNQGHQCGKCTCQFFHANVSLY
jgi:KDEL-tailed cysteine endopeptidase